MADSSETKLLSQEQNHILLTILDMIVPEDSSRSKPSAAEVDVLKFICEYEPGYIETLIQEIALVANESVKTFGNPFSSLDTATRDELISKLRSDDPFFLRGLAIWTVTCYYQDYRVMHAIDLPARAPYPLGYDVDSGDLSLLDPVKTRGKIYRDA